MSRPAADGTYPATGIRRRMLREPRSLAQTAGKTSGIVGDKVGYPNQGHFLTECRLTQPNFFVTDIVAGDDPSRTGERASSGRNGVSEGSGEQPQGIDSSRART